jgi:hypothetical protein
MDCWTSAAGLAANRTGFSSTEKLSSDFVVQIYCCADNMEIESASEFASEGGYKWSDVRCLRSYPFHSKGLCLSLHLGLYS